MASHHQSVDELYRTLTNQEKSLVDELINGRRQFNQTLSKRKNLEEDEQTIECCHDGSCIGCSSCRTYHDCDSVADNCEEENNEAGIAMQELFQCNPNNLKTKADDANEVKDPLKEEQHPYQGFYEIENKPELLHPTDQDYEVVPRRLSAVKTVLLVEEFEDYDCDDPAAFDNFAVEAAIERLGLEDKNVSDYIVAGRRASLPNLPRKQSLNLFTSKKEQPKAASFKQFLRGLRMQRSKLNERNGYLGYSDRSFSKELKLGHVPSRRFSLQTSPSSKSALHQEVKCDLPQNNRFKSFFRRFMKIASLSNAAKRDNSLAMISKAGSKGDISSILSGYCDVSDVLLCLRRLSFQKGMNLSQEENCFRILFEMTKSPEKAKEFAFLYGVPLIISIMEDRKRNLSLLRNAVGILLNITLTCAEYVISQPRLFTNLVTIMKQHSSSVSLLDSSLSILQKIAFLKDEASTDCMIKADVVQTVMYVIKIHSRHIDLLQKGMALLSALCIAREEARMMVATSDNLINVVKVAKTYEKKILIHREAFKLLRCLKEIPSENLNLPLSLLKDKSFTMIFRRASLLDKFKRIEY